MTTSTDTTRNQSNEYTADLKISKASSLENEIYQRILFYYQNENLVFKHDYIPWIIHFIQNTLNFSIVVVEDSLGKHAGRTKHKIVYNVGLHILNYYKVNEDVLELYKQYAHNFINSAVELTNYMSNLKTRNNWAMCFCFPNIWKK